MTPEEQWLLKKEKLLAWLRVGFALAAILVIQLNPARVARFPIVSHLSLYSFLLYSLLVLYLLTREISDSRKIGLATTCLDLLWISVIVFSTGGSRTPFFVYYLFPVITASSRYGVKGSLAVALVGVTLFGLMRFSPFWTRPIDIDTYIIRSVYLLVVAYIFGFISDFENKQNQRLFALSKTVGEVAVQDERRRIGRELHDRLLQTLASLILRLEACRKHLIHEPQELAQELQLMEEATRTSMEEIRGFLAGKSDHAFAPGTLVERLQGELKFLRDQLGLRAVLQSEPEELNLPQRVEQEVYYILREGLMNVARHSQASELTLSLRQTERVLKGSLEDNGVGFDLARDGNGRGYGLQGMRERIEKLEGHFSLKTSPGRGTEISFTVPLEGN
jgi:signal transduction histidine kinase